ncbi:hypothetical protein SERLA73DRAFT_162832 [Serpula lacrymans var. lacrymans S7.3]|uniref:CHAT domain-containing protein n=2 Tax=Serpula lacrymans var. lacrymans TaxID=341189 RepID=F8QAE7_SERL3|nr:uncharacterized protein SERLADRAFT_417975 [Serpula lacrymans var. lacrymans S7.9]EGN94737.1 hypothetical protein SERLA73DRAFT_162832 [Serpula lacrymans var. lacrymans S7.3]EGO20215.1 hypothetical protein SERLADRAFT_417975 [Serpula lacrymans var. lacrymans S7.9]
MELNSILSNLSLESEIDMWLNYTRLSISLQSRFQDLGDFNDLELSIQGFRGALALCPPGSPNRATSQSNLANTLLTRFKQRGDFSDLNSAIELQQDALNSRSPGHSEYPSSQNNLANALLARFQQRGNSADLDLAIEHFRGAVRSFPPEHPVHPLIQGNLANSLISRFEQRGQFEDLKSAITQYEIAVQLCPEEHQHRSQLQCDYANVLLTRFEQRGDPRDLDLSIVNHIAALKVRPEGHPYRIISQCNLANALVTRFGKQGDTNDLELAINHFRSAVGTCPEGHPERPAALSNLAQALLTRFSQQGNSEDLDSAIIYLQDVLTLRPAGHPGRPTSHGSLAISLITRFEQRGDPNDLDSAIQHFRDALELCPPHHPRYQMFKDNLASALRTRFEQRGDSSDLDTAIQHSKTSLQPTSRADPSLHNNIGNLLHDRFKQRGDVKDLELSIEHFRKALDLCSPVHPSLYSFQSNYAGALLSQSDSQGDLDSLDTAIQFYRRALELCPPGHPRRFSSLFNLANILLSRFAKQSNIQDLEMAIAHSREALALCPPGHTDRPSSQSALATALHSLFEQQKDIANLDEAIQHLQNVLDTASQGHSYRPSWQNYLASAFHSRYTFQRNVDDLEKAIEHYRTALRLRPPEHPSRPLLQIQIARALGDRFDCKSEYTDVMVAFRFLYVAKDSLPDGHPQLYFVYEALAEAHTRHFTLFDRFPHLRHLSPIDLSEEKKQAFLYFKEACTYPTASPRSRLKSSVRWIIAAEREGGSALEAYRTCLTLLNLHATNGSSVSKRHELLRETPPRIASSAASCAIREGLIDVAVELLEQGRTLLWGQLVRFRTPLDELCLMGKDGYRLASEFTRLSKQLEQDNTLLNLDMDYSVQRSFDESVRLYRERRNEWDSVVAQIRDLQGFTHFLKPVPFSELQKASKEGPVIIVNVSWYSCDAIIVLQSGQPRLVPLPELTLDIVSQLASEFEESLSSSCGSGEEKIRERKITYVLRQLWNLVVHPLVRELVSLEVPKGSRIWWCPTNRFASLPLHAAGPYRKGEENLPQLFISSYTPSLSALIRSRERTSANSVSNSIPSFIAVAQANPYGKSQERELKSVGTELSIVKGYIPPSMAYSELTGASGTSDDALANLRTHGWVHLACHGKQDLSQPFDSSFAMGDKPLRLVDIIHARLEQPEFAFLSACHTAGGDRNTPDEVIHLAAGMQFSGFRSVVGTLWAVDDGTAHHMVSHFYKHFFEAGCDSTRAAEALNKAARTVNKREVPLDQRIVFIHIGA